jgi:hypothetical protein
MRSTRGGPAGFRAALRLSSRRQQMRQQARARKPSWMSSQRSVRMSSRRRLWSQAKVRSTTQRCRPRPDPTDADGLRDRRAGPFIQLEVL